METYVRGVSNLDLASAAGSHEIDPGAAALLPAEREYVAARRKAHGLALDPPTAALALSGGGIRSAAFALGVMQKLAAENYVRLFDYLSTVSGGGFIGASLTWFTSKPFRELKQARFGVGDGDPFPYGADDPSRPVLRYPLKDEDRLLSFLQSHGQYLIPGGGITLASGIAVVLRGILLNLLVWFPIGSCLTAILIAIPSDRLLGNSWEVTHGYFCLEWEQAAACGCTPDRIALCVPSGFAVILILAILLWLAFVAGSIWYSFRTYMKRSPNARRYRQRRRFEWLTGNMLLCAAGLTVIGTLPWVAGIVNVYVGEKGGFGSLLVGIAGGIWSFFKTGSDKDSKVPLEVVAPIAALLFCYGFLILAYDTGQFLFQFTADSGGWLGIPWLGQILIICTLAVPSVLLGWLVNLNYLTLHRYYRDRLMEAFMPDFDRVIEDTAGAAYKVDAVPLSQMCDIEQPTGPYHLINTNLILTGSKDKTRHLRGGDSFILSPRYCGSNATGWRMTEKFLGDEMTLPTAMAISGAAANPDAGSGGVGVTRNPIVSIVMSLLNIRLGYWIANPLKDGRFSRPNHFMPGLSDLVDQDRDETSRILRLSDGGHFDNLGLYELIRRRVEFIVVSDAGADPDCRFSDLTNAMARAEQDFGARIVFEDDPALAPLMPTVDLAFPRSDRRAHRGHARAKIIYADGSTGTLIYLTTMIVDKLRLQLLGYLGANPSFPDETTADQFFSEAQFDAYRELGYAVASQMLDGPDGCRGEFTTRLSRLGVAP